MIFTLQIPANAATKQARTSKGVYGYIEELTDEYVSIECKDTQDEEFEVQVRDNTGKEVFSQREIGYFFVELSKNKLYSFRVRGMKINYDTDSYDPYTPWSNSVYFSTAQYKLKQVGKTKKAKITTPKVAGISKYTVYMSLKKNGGYKKVKTVKAGKSITAGKIHVELECIQKNCHNNRKPGIFLMICKNSADIHIYTVRKKNFLKKPPHDKLSAKTKLLIIKMMFCF